MHVWVYNAIYISKILSDQSHKIRQPSPFRTSHTDPCLSLRVSPEAKTFLTSPWTCQERILRDARSVTGNFHIISYKRTRTFHRQDMKHVRSARAKQDSFKVATDPAESFCFSEDQTRASSSDEIRTSPFEASSFLDGKVVALLSYNCSQTGLYFQREEVA